LPSLLSGFVAQQTSDRLTGGAEEDARQPTERKSLFEPCDHRFTVGQGMEGVQLMMPSPGFFHSQFQAQIMEGLRDLLGEAGSAQPTCPLSTLGGLKVVDVI